MFNDASRRSVFEHLEPRLLLSTATESADLVSVQWKGQTAQARSDEWIVRLDDGVDWGDYSNLLESSLVDSGIKDGSLSHAGRSLFALLTARGGSVKQVVAWAGEQAGVLYVEPNFVHSISGAGVATIPDDPAVTDGSLWALHNTGQNGGTVDADIDAPEAWTLTTGSSDVVIAVIDTGIDYTHPDLAGNMWINPGEIAGDGIDNDSNGYIDDIYGWDFGDDGDNDPMDVDSHGTHLAGTIGGVGNDSAGISGVNWNVSIMALKDTDDEGYGSTYDTLMAVEYATMMRRDYGVNVVAANHSWAEYMHYKALRDAIELSGREGILSITAASNETSNNDFVDMYPSNYESQYILSVAATDRNDELAYFSNYGGATVDLGAPGVDIYSTVPGGGYAWKDGTSMSAPHVAGVVGLLAAYNPTATAGEIRQAILGGVDQIESLAGKTITGGRLNALGALELLGTFGPEVMSVSPSGGLFQIDEVTVYFSEGIVPASLVGANFLLRSNGADNVFDTADDAVHAIGDSELSQPQADRVVVSLPVNLPPETYRMTIAGSGSTPVRDSDGKALNEGGDYEHFFTIISLGDANEPDDIIATATPSGLGALSAVAFDGEIGDGDTEYMEDDIDLFEIQINEPVMLLAETDTDTAGSELDTFLRLFDAAGNELAFDDDGAATYTGTQTGTDSRIEYVLNSAGTYYVGVSSFENEGYDPNNYDDRLYGWSFGEYRLTLMLQSFPEIHGNKWDDRNGDGLRDEGEGPLGGWTIFLDSDVDGVLDVGERSTTTDAEGNFSFTDVPPGVYAVGEIAQDGWERTYPAVVVTGSYVGYSMTNPEFEDISASGQGVLAGADDESHHLTSADLGDFEFSMYDVVYEEIYINSNGLLTFDAIDDPADSYRNGDLDMYLEGAAIAVLWDDLIVSTPSEWELDTAVYWEVRGSGSDERLIVQWNNVDYAEADVYAAITFQAILRADGSITFNYGELYNDDIGNEGQWATVGVRDAGVYADRRTLLAYDSDSGEFVGTGKSTHLFRPLLGQHVVRLGIGEVETGVLFGSWRDSSLGDANRDGTVDSGDVDIFVGQFGVRGQDTSSDFDRDGDVDLRDFAILRDNFGTSAIVAQVNSAPAVRAISQSIGSAPGPVGEIMPERPLLRQRAPRPAADIPVAPQPEETSPSASDTTDLLAWVTPLDMTLGVLSTADDRIDTPGVRAARHLSDRGYSSAEAEVPDGFIGLNDPLGSVFVDVLDRGLA
ncbi:MAG: S8 family serine peptidase [Phycisphaerae bacterium]|jgi:subtilisin family serine protease|nr:S8 family serine peptidase [Phycisphaerae bacterium]